MRRLYLRIYLAVLASLLVFTLLLGAAWHLWSRGQDKPQSLALLSEAVADLLPADAPPAQLQAMLQRWHLRTGTDLALHAADGSRIVAAGQPLPLPSEGDFDDDERGSWIRGRDGPPAYALRLADGRVLVAGRLWRAGGFGRPPLPGFFSTIVLIALAIGVGAYPVVRRLTRRLERLQQAVEQLGTGDLSVRVPVAGRDEVAALGESFNRSADRIETLLRSHRSLLANASHELRSPLARIRMAIELLGPHAPAAARDEVARSIAELDQLVDEILLASRLDATPPHGAARAGAGAAGIGASSDREQVDLTALAAEECARVGAQLTAQPVTVSGDARLLRRLLRNLLENAQRYGAGSPIEVRVDRPAQRGGPVVLLVCDRGAGIAQEERERIFEPFYRARGASERSGGVGLGLALVRQIAEHHEGSVACLPREGGGSCFRVSLPAGAGY
jgi:signal transduction histidine kinase